MSLVHATAVSKEFRHGNQVVEALRDVDLTVGTGELVVVTGDSGSGKSTLLSILGAIDTATRGAVHIDGENLNRATPARLARIRTGIGYVFQDFLLVPHLTAVDNVRLPLLFTDGAAEPGRAEELLERVGMSPRMGHLPGALSRGEMQRVAFARALVNRPRLLFADEPTANLDRRNCLEIWCLIHELKQLDSLTVVVATHSPATDTVPDRVFHLEDGKLRTNEEDSTDADPGAGSGVAG